MTPDPQAPHTLINNNSRVKMHCWEDDGRHFKGRTVAFLDMKGRECVRHGQSWNKWLKGKAEDTQKVKMKAV